MIGDSKLLIDQTIGTVRTKNRDDEFDQVKVGRTRHGLDAHVMRTNGISRKVKVILSGKRYIPEGTKFGKRPAGFGERGAGGGLRS